MILFEHQFKETGENPVRARRRKVQKGIFLTLLPQKGDKPLDFSEKVKNVHQVEILADKIIFINCECRCVISHKDEII